MSVIIMPHASTVWNPITSTDATVLERIRRKLVTLRQYRFFTYDLVTEEDYLNP